MPAPWDPAQRIDQWNAWIDGRSIKGRTKIEDEAATLTFKGMKGNHTIEVDVTFDKETGAADFVMFTWDDGRQETCDLSVKADRDAVERTLWDFLEATE